MTDISTARGAVTAADDGLVAILSADAVGTSRLMAEDEAVRVAQP